MVYNGTCGGANVSRMLGTNQNNGYMRERSIHDRPSKLRNQRTQRCNNVGFGLITGGFEGFSAGAVADVFVVEILFFAAEFFAAEFARGVVECVFFASK